MRERDRRIVSGVIAALASSLLLAALFARADAPASANYLSYMPSPEKVLADFQGKDVVDTAERQHAAFKLLRDAVEVFSDSNYMLARQKMPQSAQAQWKTYGVAMDRVEAQIQKTFDPACKGENCDKFRYYNGTWQKEFNNDFRREVAGKYFPVNLQTAFMQAKDKNDHKNAVSTASTSSAPSTLQGLPASLADWGYFIVGLLPIAGLLWLLWWFLTRDRGTDTPLPRSTAPAVSTNHGSARFAAAQERPSRADAPCHGVFLGKSIAPDITNKYSKTNAPAPFAPVYTAPETHTLIIARTRSGKGTRVIVPTLLRYQGSVLTIDPKGENAAITARCRQHMPGQFVYVINPWGELADTFGKLGLPSATFNPLDVLDRDDPNVVAIAQSLAITICQPAQNTKDAFWQSSAANLLTATLLWITETPEEKKTLARAREIITKTRKELRDDFLIPMAVSEAFGGAIKELASAFIDMAPETYSGVIANLGEATRFLSDPRIKASTETSSFSMRDLVKNRVTVYVVIPTDRMDTQRTWLRLVLASAMHSLKRTKKEERGNHRCMFLIDEFPALGKLDDIPRDIATMAGYGLDFTLVVQGLDQLRATYGDSAGTILSNCGYKWFCNVGDLDSAKYLSESVGQKTVQTVGSSTSSGTTSNPQHEQPGHSSGSSTTYGEMGRALLMPDEILNMGNKRAICLNPHDRPYLLLPVDYWKLQTSFAHLKDEYPQLYWQPPLAWDENPYHKTASTAVT